MAIAITYSFRLDIPFRWTDDAYVHGNEVFLVARETGTVTTINADDTYLVREGQPVVILDDDDQRVALLQAEGALGNTMRTVCQFYVNVVQLEANVDARKVDLARAADDYHRRITSLPGTVSSEDVIHALQTLEAASDSLAIAQQQLTAAEALTANTDLERHPQVLQAEANILNADLALQRTVVRAPATGYVVQRTAEVGQRVTIGTDLLAIIPLNQIWVDANFKEAQLSRMRIGQPVSVTADIYGSSVTYHGHVAGLAAGSGDAFALLPPQNASGNWIKIVQRLPVRVEFDKGELQKHPLRIGLSTSVRVDTRDTSGPLLSETVRPPEPEDSTERIRIAHANALIASIVAANGGSPSAP